MYVAVVRPRSPFVLIYFDAQTKWDAWNSCVALVLGQVKSLQLFSFISSLDYLSGRTYSCVLVQSEWPNLLRCLCWNSIYVCAKQLIESVSGTTVSSGLAYWNQFYHTVILATWRAHSSASFVRMGACAVCVSVFGLAGRVYAIMRASIRPLYWYVLFLLLLPLFLFQPVYVSITIIQFICFVCSALAKAKASHPNITLECRMWNQNWLHEMKRCHSQTNKDEMYGLALIATKTRQTPAKFIRVPAGELYTDRYVIQLYGVCGYTGLPSNTQRGRAIQIIFV